MFEFSGNIQLSLVFLSIRDLGTLLLATNSLRLSWSKKTRASTSALQTIQLEKCHVENDQSATTNIRLYQSVSEYSGVSISDDQSTATNIRTMSISHLENDRSTSANIRTFGDLPVALAVLEHCCTKCELNNQ